MARHTIGFGGGCHWCTEAVFSSLIGIHGVRQGWLASKPPDDAMSEGVLVDFDPRIIPLETLIEIHLRSHSSTAEHSMRGKYRSAIYTLNPTQNKIAKATIERLQNEFENAIITKTIRFSEFQLNSERFLNYYAKNPDKPFCQNYIDPKLNELRKRYAGYMVKS